jgi:hypothetical protein
LNAEGRILSVDWSRYDGRHVVFRPVGMSVEELQDGLHRAWRQTYTFSSILRRAVGSSALPFSGVVANLFFRRFSKTFLTPPAGEQGG